MTRCDVCPADPAHVCLAHSTGHLRFCELARTDLAYRDKIRRESSADAKPVERTPKAPMSDAEIRARALVETCDFLSGCHCGGNALCLLGGYPAPASWPICLACPVRDT